MRDDRVYLRHILRCISSIEVYLQGGKQAFDSSPLIQDAILRNPQTMAESTQRLSQAQKDRRPEIEWTAISGLRNVLVHDYLGVDLEQIYRAIRVDMPGLRMACEQLLESISPPE